MCLVMAKQCSKCGNQLSFFKGILNNICDDCQTKIEKEEERLKSERDAELLKIKIDISVNKTISDNQINILKKYDKKQLLDLFNEIFNQYETDGGLEMNEIITLSKMQVDLGLSNGEIEFEEKVLPHILLKIKNDISVNKTVSDEQLEILRKYDKKHILKLFDEIFNQYETDGGLEKNEILTLQTMQHCLGLTNVEIKFEEKILPHILVYSIRSENKIPPSTIHFPDNISNIILKNGEEMHYATSVILKETRVVNLGYVGGSHGISFPIGMGIRYRVGAHRGHINKQERMVETSRGFLIITNKRLFLQPFPGQKPMSLPLNKILSYHCFENGIEVFKEGREKGFFFQTFTLGSPEIFGILLEFLVRNN